MKNLSKSRFRLGVVFLIILIYSCSAERPIEKECNLSGIQGQWDWVESTGGVSGAYLTPLNSGWNKRIEINDSLWSEFKNDTLTYSSLYTFSRDTNSQFIQGFVLLKDPPGKAIRIYNCTMTISGLFEDSLEHKYEYKSK